VIFGLIEARCNEIRAVTDHTGSQIAGPVALTDIRRITKHFERFSVPLRRTARKFERWLTVRAAKSLDWSPQRPGTHFLACLRRYLDPRPLPRLPLLASNTGPGGARSRAISTRMALDFLPAVKD
jgi:hypothetical protein